MQTPKYALSEVRKLAHEWKQGKDSGYFSAHSASIEYVAYIFSYGEKDAEQLILDGILKLESADFARRVMQWGVVIADEYGLKDYLGYDWYVKFTIEDDVLEEISFHPLEKALKLADGRILRNIIEQAEIPAWRRKGK